MPAVSKLVERPVKWTETRTEAVQNAYAGRGQIYDVEASAKKDGTLLGMRVTQLLDCGAYIGTFGAFQTCACLLAGGAYKWKAISSRSIGVLTNKITTDPYRGAGRPEATHVAERMIDLLAVELKMDPVELRRKNFPAKEEFPFTQNFGLVMDSGDYNASLDKALKLFGYDQMRREQAEARKQGKLVGIGLSTWIEICGLGPSAATAAAADDAGGAVRVGPGQGPPGRRGKHLCRHSQPRPGQRHDSRSDRRRRAWRPDRTDRHPPRRHQRGAGLRLRHLWFPHAGGGRSRDQSRLRQGGREGQESRGPHPRGG